jgi:drug/metabolite transporter (DMT)-like permease
MTAEAAAPRIGLAALWMAGAIASFTLMAIAGRTVGTSHDTFEIMLYRSLVGLAVVVAVLAARGQTALIRTRRPGLHALRNLAHFAGQNLWFYALTVLPLAQVFALEFTTPIWTLLLAPALLGEAITRRGAVAAALGFAGILIVTHPGPGSLGPGLGAGALCAVGFALSAIFTRSLTRTDSIVSILFWLHLMHTCLALVAAWAWNGIALPTAATLPWLFLIGLLGLSAHLCLTTALSLAPTHVVMPMDFVRLPVIVVVGVLVYAEPLDPLVILGGGIILLANWINLAGTGRTGPADPP